MTFKFILLLSLFFLHTSNAQTECSALVEVTTGGSVSSGAYSTLHGKLKLNDNKLVDASNIPVQLVGMSSNVLTYFASCYTFASLQYYVANWGITVFRIDVNIDIGYIANPAGTKQTIDNIVSWCETLGIYVIIDWKVLEHGDPNYYLTSQGAATGVAIDFWKEMATKYKDKTHVIYEIASEPNGVTWDTALAYHNSVIAAIRSIDAYTVILVGTTTWSQDIQNPYTKPVANPYNVMYTFHFYAGNHDYLFDRISQYSTLLPIFISAFGVSTYNGMNTPSLTIATKFLNLFQTNSISWVMFALCDGINDGATDYNAIVTAGACGYGTWGSASCAGIFLKNKVREIRLSELSAATLLPTSVPSSCPSSSPSLIPSALPTSNPSFRPTCPSRKPTTSPTFFPTRPTVVPTAKPTRKPTFCPSSFPSTSPSVSPSVSPSLNPTTFTPTRTPSKAPTREPSAAPTSPTSRPTRRPTYAPSRTRTPTSPSRTPTRKPSSRPTATPSRSPTILPTKTPVVTIATVSPSITPTNMPTIVPSVCPTRFPTSMPTINPAFVQTCANIVENTGETVSSIGYSTLHGKLTLNGIKLVDASNNPVQLVGLTSNVLSYFGKCYTFASLQYFAVNWGITVFRITVAIDNAGYTADPVGTKQTIDNIVTWCETLGIYVIIDWNVLEHGDPNYYLTSQGAATGVAIDFWKEMATKYKDKTHVIYEIANEPNGVTWDTVLAYHNSVIAAIRSIDADTIILAGTISWSTDIQIPFTKPVANPYNVMYTFHFFAGNHDYLFDLTTQYVTKVPVFVSFFGVSTYDGTTAPSFTVASNYLSLFERNSISWVMFSLTDSNIDLNALLTEGSCAAANWVSASCAGIYGKNKIRSIRRSDLSKFSSSPSIIPSAAPSSPTSTPTRSPTSPSRTPTRAPTNSPSRQPTAFPSSTWATITGYTYGDDTTGTIGSSIVASYALCQALCGLGCDFITYNSATQKCNIKYTDKAAYVGMSFKGQAGYLFGYLRNGGITTLSTSITASIDACKALCNANTACQYVDFDYRNTPDYSCNLQSLQVAATTTIGFRAIVYPPNYDPANLGRFDVIGNTGVVAIMANLLPSGKLLFTARPEYDRGGPNTDNISPIASRAAQVPYGEIGSVFDPSDGTHIPSQIDDNFFCHGSVLMDDGRIFTAGGDNGPDMNRDAATGLTNGLQNFRYYDPTTNLWTVMQSRLQVTRWYPSVIRTTAEKYFIIGGMSDWTGKNLQTSMELWDSTQPNSNTQFINLRVLQTTYTVGYPFVDFIPQTGNIFVFASRNFDILDKNTGALIDQEIAPVHGYRSGDYPGASCLLPLKEDSTTGFVKAERIWFGGVESAYVDETAVTDIARLVLTDPVGQKQWTYDSDPMPYGRVVSDCVLYPNGHILIFNGARRGRTGGSIGVPLMSAAANDVFDYNPDAPAGQKFKVLAATPNQRFYHSNAILIPDGRVIVCGTDQATYVTGKTSYSHMAEAFTPPWLLDGTPRPVIQSVPAAVIAYNSQFTITYTGTVTKISIITPQASTHGTEFTQRLFYPTVISQTDTTITLKAPTDRTILTKGYHMIFVVNNNTPSVGQWIRFG